MKRAIILAILLSGGGFAVPRIVQAQVLRSTPPSFLNLGGATLTFDGSSIVSSVNLKAPRFEATAGSGSNAFSVLTSGAKTDFGDGASDYASSDGTTVTFAGPLAGASTIAATGNLSGANFSGTSSGTNTGDITLGAVGASPNANGASLSGQQLTLQPADGTNPGVLTAGTQTIGGAKTFSSSLNSTVASGSDGLSLLAGAHLHLGTGYLSGNTTIDSSIGLKAPALQLTALAGENAVTMISGAKFCINTGCSVYLMEAGFYGAVFRAVYGFSADAGGFLSTNSGGVTSREADSATANGVIFQTTTAYTTAGARLITGKNYTTTKWGIDKDGTYIMDGTDASGTPGAATINQPIGQVTIDDGASSVVVTNSLVTTSSVVLPVLQFIDATCTQILSCVPGTGSFTITMNAACTSHTKVGFVLHNYF